MKHNKQINNCIIVSSSHETMLGMEKINMDNRENSQ